MFKGAVESFAGGRELSLEVTYYTRWGQALRVCATALHHVTGGREEDDDDDELKAMVFAPRKMQWTRGHVWTVDLSLPPRTARVTYSFELYEEATGATLRREKCRPHAINFHAKTPAKPLRVIERWDHSCPDDQE